MPLKSRNFRRSLGAVSAGSYSDEVDMSNVTRGVLYVTPDSSYSANFDIEVYISPQDFGTTPDWYRLWGVTWVLFSGDVPSEMDLTVGYNASRSDDGGPQAMPFPIPYRLYTNDKAYASEGVSPRRVRFKPVGTDVTLSVEGTRFVS